MRAFPDSVYEFGNWLKAHPCVKRVRLDNRTFERYLSQIWDQHTEYYGLDTILTWCDRVKLYPPHLWRRA